MTESVIGFIIVIITAAAILVLSSRRIREAFPPAFRSITGITNLRRAIDLSVEDGSRVHVSVGNADLTETTNASALVGLSSLHRIGQLSTTSDLPPICTSGDGGTALLSKDVLHAVAKETNTRETYNGDQGYLTGSNPFSFALGAMDVIADPAVKTNVFIGNFGAEAGFLSTAAEKETTTVLAASDSIVAQAIFMATSRDVLIGEELFAIPAYLGYKPAHSASLQVQDYLRLIISAALLIGALLKVMGVI